MSKKRSTEHKGMRGQRGGQASRLAWMLMTCVILILAVCGCESLRFGVNEGQKENAWLHNRTAAAAAQVAEVQGGSAELRDLTELSELQSRAFTAYFGMPNEYPAARTVEDILADSNRLLATDAIEDSKARPNAWDVADAGLELGIGIFAVLGGVYGAKGAKFLKDARAKSKAIKEIIAGNELFKNANRKQAEAFKQAHATQSPETRQIVVEMKG